MGKYTYDILTSPEYKNGSPNLRKEIEDKMFENHIKPYGLAHGVNFDRDTYFKNWTGEGKQPEIEKPSAVDLALGFAGKAIQKALDIEKVGVKIDAHFAGIDSKTVDRLFDTGYAGAYRKKIDDSMNELYSTYERTPWSKSWSLGLAGAAGDQLPQLPLYMTGGELSGIASGAIKAGPVATFFAKRAIDFSEGFLVQAAQGGTLRDNSKLGASFVIGNPVLGYLGKILSIGGRKLVASKLAEATEVLEGEYMNMEAPKRLPSGATKALPPAGIHQGPVETPASPIGEPPQLPQGKAQDIQFKDPVVKAHAEMLNQIAREEYGKIGYNFLKPKEKVQVLRKIGLMAGKAAQNVARIAPEEFKANVTAEVAQTAEKNPAVGKLVEEFKKTGLDIAEAAQKHTARMEKAASIVDGVQIKEVPGAATKKNLMFLDNALAQVEKELGDFKFESKANSLLALHAYMRENPKQYTAHMRSIVLQHLMDFYGPKGATVTDVLAMSRQMRELLPKIKMMQSDPSGAGKHGMKVFASHFRPGKGVKPNRWANMLKKDVEERFGKTVPEPAWPEEYRNAPKTMSSSSGAGANYTADQLAEFKKKHGIK